MEGQAHIKKSEWLLMNAHEEKLSYTEQSSLSTD